MQIVDCHFINFHLLPIDRQFVIQPHLDQTIATTYF
jgi:hypothetical protein